MLRIAALLPDDVFAELYEVPAYPGMTFLELRLVPEAAAYRSTLRVIYPDGSREQAV